MLYIKIGKQKYPCKFQVFTTQLGNDGIRIIGDVPLANGFQIVDENDNLITDRSEYTYLYREDDTCKEYTKVAEEIIPTEGFTLGTPSSPYDVLSRRISAVNNRVSDITPYTESKDVYIGNTECIFNKPKDGNISAWLTVGNEQIPCTYEVVNDMIVVSFEALEEVGTVNISIQ